MNRRSFFKVVIFTVMISLGLNSAGWVQFIEAKPAAKTSMNLSAYEGTWTDKNLNLLTSLDYENSLEIYIPEGKGDEGEISLFLYNPERVTDSSSHFKVSGNQANFVFDDSAGHGKGSIKFMKNEIHLKLQLDRASKDLKQLYSKERVFVRNPYKNVKRQSALQLVREYLHLKDLKYLKLNEGAEWNEGLEAGTEIEVVNRIDKSGRVVQMFLVNTLNGRIKILH